MRRFALILGALLLTTGAGPSRSLPVPPIPPAHPPAGQSAPVPDRDIQAPVETASQGTTVVPQDFRFRQFNQSLAYPPGSRFATSEDKRPIQTPGLTLRVPLQ